MRLFEALPDAFIYRVEGTEADGLVRLSFKPNQAFSAPSRETRVFEGMEGNMWIHPGDRRIARFEGKLISDVHFGWGIFGRLFRGGRLAMEQTKVDDRNWRITRLVLVLDGRILLFKTLRIRERQSASHFHGVSDQLTLAEAIRSLQSEIQR